MYARTSTWRGTPEAMERWASHARERVSPMVARLPGNAGSYFLVDRAGGTGLTLTLWESEEAARASDQAADRSRDSTIAATGAELLQRGRFEVLGERERLEQNKRVSRRFTELFSAGDQAPAEDVLAADVVFHGTSADGEVRGIEAMKVFLSAYQAAFPDAHSTVEEQLADGDTVVTRWCARGTHEGALGAVAPTGRAFELHGITIERIAEGKIAEVWVARDELGLLGQLGLLPEPVAAGG